MWALYHRTRGWLLDSVDTYTWKVADAAEYPTEQRARETIDEMNRSLGTQLRHIDFTACRVR